MTVHGNFKGATLVDKLEGARESVEQRDCIKLEGQAYDRLYRGVTGQLELTCV